MVPICRLSTFMLSVGLLVSLTARAQSSYDLFGSARADALGNATTASVSAVGVHANPASRAAVSDRTAVFYARQGFGLSVLRYGASHATMPFDWGAVSAGASTFGFDQYREVHLSTGYAHSIGLGTTRRIHAGVTTRYYHTSITGYGSAGGLGVNLGFVVQLLRSLHLGAHATNMNGGAIVDDEPLPRTLAVGLGYRALERMHVLVDIFKDVRFPAEVRGGIEVRPVSPLFLRVGVTIPPARFAGGAGIRLGPLRADVAVEQHQELGWSPSGSLLVRW